MKNKTKININNFNNKTYQTIRDILAHIPPHVFQLKYVTTNIHIFK